MVAWWGVDWLGWGVDWLGWGWGVDWLGWGCNCGGLQLQYALVTTTPQLK